VNISVLLPSRGRPGPLAESIASLDGNADDPGQVQILIAADPDDEPTWSFPARQPSVTWIAPGRYGYVRLHEYVNQIARMASGDWLMLWNDDARMLTPGWDTIITGSPPGVLWSAANHDGHCNLFPAWPRSWTDAIGHVSLCWNCDTWMQEIGAAVGRQWQVPVRVFHDRADITGGHDDQTWEEGRDRGDMSSVFCEARFRDQRAADAAKIRDLLPQQEDAR